MRARSELVAQVAQEGAAIRDVLILFYAERRLAVDHPEYPPAQVRLRDHDLHLIRGRAVDRADLRNLVQTSGICLSWFRTLTG